MKRQFLVLFLAIATGAYACCYTLQSNPRAANIPIYTWYLNTLSQTAVKPTDCANEIHAVDRPGLSALSACELIGVEYRPMAFPKQDWIVANLTDARQVIFTQPCVGFGPYRAGDRTSSLLLHKFSDAWLRLQVLCDDSKYASCVTLGLRMRQAGTSRLVIEEQTDPFLGQCMRTASPTPSTSVSPSRTPTNSPTPSPTSTPEYGSSLWRVEASFGDGIFVAMQFGLDYQKLVDSHGELGAHWCPVPVLDAAHTVLMTTLYADATSEDHTRRSHGSNSMVEWAQNQLDAKGTIRVTVVWNQGGWCRVELTPSGSMTFVGCRIFIGTDVYETMTYSRVTKLDARMGPLCGVVVAISEPTPSIQAGPIHCGRELGWRYDAQKAIVIVSSPAIYAEVKLAWITCSDHTERPRFDSTSSLLDLELHTELECRIDETTASKVYCGDQLIVAIAGTMCESIESPISSVRACVPESEAILFV